MGENKRGGDTPYPSCTHLGKGILLNPLLPSNDVLTKGKKKIPGRARARPGSTDRLGVLIQVSFWFASLRFVDLRRLPWRSSALLLWFSTQIIHTYELVYVANRRKGLVDLRRDDAAAHLFDFSDQGWGVLWP